VAVGRGGERRVRALLLDELPPGTWVLSNVRVPGLTGDADLVVIGSSGVFLIEVKTWSGQITCGLDGKSWRRITADGHPEKLADPGTQVRRTIHALRAYLETADPMLCMRTQLWIEGLALFAHPRASVDGRSCPVPVLSPWEAAQAISGAEPRRRLIKADQDRIVELLAAVQPDGALDAMRTGGSRVA
jgi:hypothetical protein